MDFTLVDRYLLGDPTSKADAIAFLLANRSSAPAAAPFYRGLEAVGVRAADEALLALRLVLAGREPSDENVRRLRAFSATARAATNGDERTLATVRRRDAELLDPILGSGDLPGAVAAARSAYAAELS